MAISFTGTLCSGVPEYLLSKEIAAQADFVNIQDDYMNYY